MLQINKSSILLAIIFKLIKTVAQKDSDLMEICEACFVPIPAIRLI